jgi:hypothetical protein
MVLLPRSDRNARAIHFSSDAKSASAENKETAKR